MTRGAAAAAALVLSLLVVAEIDVARSLSATCDEPAHIAGGFTALEHRAFVFSAEHPPLPRLLSAGTLRLLGVREGSAARRAWETADVSTPSSEVASITSYVDAWLGRDNATFEFPGSRPGVDSVVTAARLPGAVLFPLLTGLVAFLWARQRFGDAGGLVSLVLVATHPDLLGHGALATTDAAVTAFGLLSAYLVWSVARRGGRARILAMGLALGATVTAKASGLFVVTALLAVVAVQVAWPVDPSSAGFDHPLGAGPARARLGPVAVCVLVAALAAVATCWVMYLGRNPLTSGIAGLHRVQIAAPRTAPVLCLGTYHDGGVWHYFLSCLGLKTSVGALVVLVLTVVAARDPRCRAGPGDEAPLHLVPIVLVLVASSFAEQLGSRYVLPAVPFLFVSAGRVAVWAAGSRARTAGVALALAGAVGGAASNHPFHATSLNALAGPRVESHRWLDDSNVDWGQGLEALADWQKTRGVAEVTVVSASSRYTSLDLLSAYGVVGVAAKTARPFYEPEKGHVYAVSAHLLARVIILDRRRPRRGRELVLGGSLSPTELVGGGLLIFDLR